MWRRLAPLRHVVGPLLFCVIAMRIDRAALLDALFQARGWPVLAAASAVLLAIPLRASRWTGILRGMGHPLGAGAALRLYASGTFAGTATPGRVGEMVKAAPLVTRGMPARRAVASVVLDRVFDVGAGAVVALLYGVAITRGPTTLAVVAGSLVLCLIAVAGFLAGAERSLVARCRLGRLHGATGAVQESLAAIASPESFVKALLFTAAASGCAWLANHLLVRSLGLPLGPLETAGISAAAGLAALLPVSVLGVGTRDAALLVLLAHYGIAPTDAVALSTLFLLLNIWTGLACGMAAIVPGGSTTTVSIKENPE